MSSSLNGWTFQDPQSQAVLAGILVGVITLVIIFLLARRRGRGRRDVALLGICDAGKTTMFARLLHDKGVETCTSSAANVGSYRGGDNSAPLRVVDVPGHVRIRQRLLDGAKSSLRAVVYVVDSACVQKQLRDVAEFLFAVLGDAAVGGDGSVAVMIACNKQVREQATIAYTRTNIPRRLENSSSGFIIT